MMHKAYCSTEEVPYYFSGSSIKFQGHTGWKIDDLNPISVRLLGRSQHSNPSDLPCLRSSVKFQGHTGRKINNFDSNWAFLDCNSDLNSRMAMKWHKAYRSMKFMPYCFWLRPLISVRPSSHLFDNITVIVSYYHWQMWCPCKRSRSKVTEVMTPYSCFRTVTPVWIHIWWWWCTKLGALLFSKVIHQILRSHGTKNRQFWLELSVSGL